MSSIIFVLAHLLLGGAFLVFGIRNISGAAGVASVLERRKIPEPLTAARIGIGLQIVGGTLTVLGAFVPLLSVLGGLAIIIFLVLATLLFHPFWEFAGDEQKPHINAFIMNTGLVGAFLLVAGYGL